MMRLFLLATTMAICLGCGNIASQPAATEPADYRRQDDVDFARLAMVDGSKSMNAADLAMKAGEQSRPSDIPTSENRKIIYTATLAIVVDDFDPIEQAVAALVKQHGGFIASANVSLNQGSERSGTWVVRVPVATFEDFLDASGDLGVPERRQQDGQDVTEEYVDLEARIRSKKKLEERILELLADNKGEIKDVIEVERELSRVRTEIEQMEGRLRYLTDRTELTTVNLSIREQQEYTPPQAPGLGTQIAQTFGSSTDRLTGLGKNLLLAVVASLPWLALILILLSPVLWWRRRKSVHV